MRAVAGTLASGLLLLGIALVLVDAADLAPGVSQLRPSMLAAHLVGGLVALGTAVFAEYTYGPRSQLAAAGSIVIVALIVGVAWFG
ncbi:hypothetical protein [Haloechinothrix sp. LS1_15]|uniref:hypothetical protein n=1 Tax=Haloechinothrix sp. LS1_15 TaxID=2652248 RepID=UPI00294495A8|nr:hypothetical protein [Haloechinothrix sp. LS1_15]MDV6013875.1 hypothetical protein [Haloechinothrix sp. LS1_15]